MPITYNLVSAEHLQTQADALLRAGSRLEKAAEDMKVAGLKEAWLIWSDTSDSMVSQLVGVTTTATGLIDEQVSDHRAGKPSRFVAVKKRSERLKNKTKRTQLRKKKA